MADLDKGFEEVPLDVGFEEVSLEAKPSGILPRIKAFGKKLIEPMDPATAEKLGFSTKSFSELARPDAFTYGAQEGMLLGGGGEVAGGVQGALDWGQSRLHDIGIMDESPSQVGARLKKEGFTGNIGPTSLGEVYDQSRDQQQALINKAREESPYEFFGGNIAGGLAGGMAKLPLIGTGYGMGKLAPVAAELTGASETGLIAAAKLGKMPFAQAAATEAISAAPMGAAYGALSSEPGAGNRLVGGLEGAAEGGLMALAIKGASEGVGWLGKYAVKKGGEVLDKVYSPKVGAETPSFERQKAFEAGKRGENWNSHAFQRGETPEAIAMGMTGSKGSLTNFAEREADKAAEAVLQVEKHLGEQLGNSLEEATKDGGTFNPNNPLMRDSKFGVTQVLNDPTLNVSKTTGLRDLKLKLENNSIITPVEAKTLKDDIYNVIKDFKDDVNPSSKELVSKLTKLAKDVDDSLILQVPSYSATKSRYKTFKEIISDPLISDKKASILDIGNKDKTKIGYDYFGDDLEGNRLLVKERMHEFITDLSKEGVDRPSQVFFNKIKDNFDDFLQREKTLNKGDNVEVVDKLNGLLDKVKDASITNKAKGVVKEPLTPPSTAVGPIATPISMFKGVTSALAETTSNTVLNKTANLLGRIQGGIEQGRISPSIQATLDALQKLTPNDTVKKSALLNGLLQNPVIRVFLEEQSKEQK